MSIQIVEALPRIDSKVVAVDLETTVLARTSSTKRVSADPYRDRIVSLQVSDGTDVWILRNNYISAIPLLVNPEIKKLGHNFAFDYKFLKRHLGIDTVNIHDTLLTERLLNAGTGIGNGLGDVLARRLGIFTDKTIREQFFGHSGEFSDEQIKYMADDVLHLIKIREQQIDEISRSGMGKVMSLENSLVPIVATMELDGVAFNGEMWKEHVVWIEKRMIEIRERVCGYLGLPYTPSLFGGVEMGFNLNSPDQVGGMLIKLGCDISDTREATLQDALNDESTPEMARQFIEDVLECRGWEKLLGFGYDKHVNPITRHIHASWNQLAADTGRFSCSNPNLQQVKRPSKGEPNFRSLFVAEEGTSFVIADFAQQEPRVLAYVSGDEAMIKAANELDIYAAYGEPVYGHVAAKGSDERQVLKTAVLANAYGAGYKKLAYVLKISDSEAQEIQSKLRTAFPVAHRWGDQQIQQLVQRGYITSLLGRRRYEPRALGVRGNDAHIFANMARNGPIQMASADISKEAMRRFYNWATENGYTEARIRLVVHDELVVQAPDDQIEEVKYAVAGAMTGAMEDLCPRIRAEVEAHVSKEWTK